MIRFSLDWYTCSPRGSCMPRLESPKWIRACFGAFGLGLHIWCLNLVFTFVYALLCWLMGVAPFYDNVGPLGLGWGKITPRHHVIGVQGVALVFKLRACIRVSPLTPTCQCRPMCYDLCAWPCFVRPLCVHCLCVAMWLMDPRCAVGQGG